MTVTRHAAKTLAGGAAIIAVALFAPAVSTSTNAMPPCCGIDLVTTYYATANMTGYPSARGMSRIVHSLPGAWSRPTTKSDDLLRDLRPGGTGGLAHHQLPCLPV